MGIILFALFTAMETALTVLTITKFRRLWNRNKTFLCALELIITVLVILLPVTGMKWRFAGCIVILAVRFIVSGIIYLIRRRKEASEKSKAGAIISAVMSIFIISMSLFPAFIFTGYNGLATSGEYDVLETSAILTDKSRIESNETDGSFREVPVHFYYPDGDAENCPLVLFAHGSFGYYQSNSSLYTELASNGYVVASIDHPYFAFFTKDTDGKIITVDMDFMKTAIDIQNNQYNADDEFRTERQWMEIRTADENFVLDSIKSAKSNSTLNDSWYTESDDINDEILHILSITDTNVIGLTGHSIGGAVAVQLGRERNDITAVADIDGTMLGERLAYENGRHTYIEEPYPIPILSIDNESHWKDGYTDTYAEEYGEIYVNKYVLDNAVDAREVHFEGTEHMDFTDLPLLSPTLAGMLGTGSVEPEEFVPELNKTVLNYFDYYLKGKGTLNTESWN